MKSIAAIVLSAIALPIELFIWLLAGAALACDDLLYYLEFLLIYWYYLYKADMLMLRSKEA